MCFFCKGTLEKGYTAHFTELSHCMVIIKNVPCQICGQCGEIVYSGTVIRRIEQILKATAVSTTEIAVVFYSDKAA